MAGAQVSSKEQLAIQAAEAFGSLRQYVVAVTLTCTNGDAGVGPDPGKELYLNRSESASRREPEYQAHGTNGGRREGDLVPMAEAGGNVLLVT
jgi:hypothetical protein